MGRALPISWQESGLVIEGEGKTREIAPNPRLV
jgi:hypothetical protein